MGFDTNGNWTSDFYPETDRDEHIAILASKFQQLIQTDIKSGFDNCLTRDGAGKPSANLNFNGYKITNLADGETANDAVNKGQLDSAVATPASETEAGTIQIATSAEALEATDNTKAMTPKTVGEVVRTLSTITPFCANSGNLNSGNADLISAVGGTISFKVDDGTNYAPLTCTPANSQNSFTLQSIESYDASALADGTYVLTIDKDGVITAYPYQTGYYTYTRRTAPSTPYLWFDVSKEPYNAYKYEGGAWVQFSGVPLATFVMASGIVDSYATLPYNANGYSPILDYVIESKIPTAQDPSWYRVYKSGWIEQGGHIDITADNPTILFSKTMADTLYYANVSLERSATTASGYDYISAKTSSSITVVADSTFTGATWEVKGQVA